MFAQESVMDIEKLKAEFEKLKYVEEKLEYLSFDEYLGCYVEKNNGMPVGLAAWVNGAFYGFEQAAKAQAVPEWAVIVPKLSANYLFNTVPELGFEHQDQKDTVLYHLNYMASEFRDSAKQFVEDDHAKQKTMIEAQEQSDV